MVVSFQAVAEKYPMIEGIVPRASGVKGPQTKLEE
jgi:hypothetical protein